MEGMQEVPGQLVKRIDDFVPMKRPTEIYDMAVVEFARKTCDFDPIVIMMQARFDLEIESTS